MALYDMRVAALAIGVPEAWFSSFLTRLPITGVIGGRQGHRRTLTVDSVVCAAIAHALIADAGCSAEPAVELAHRLLASTDGTITIGDGTLSLRVDMHDLRARLRTGLAGAVEQSVEVRRGRPSLRRAAGRKPAGSESALK